MSAAEIVQRAEATRELRTDADVLRYLGLDPTEPATVALFRLAQKYGLDPLLRQVEIIPTRQGPKAYVSRDGYLAVAHRSGTLRGIRTVESSKGEHGWRATVEVRTADGGLYEDSGGAGFDEATLKHRSDEHVERMAIARAERRALKRAFSILADIDADEEGPTVEAGASVRGPRPAVEAGPDPAPPTVAGSSAGPVPTVEADQWPPVAPRTATGRHSRQREARLVFNELSATERDAFVTLHAIDDLGAPWPDSAIDDLFGPATGGEQ